MPKLMQEKNEKKQLTFSFTRLYPEERTKAPEIKHKSLRRNFFEERIKEIMFLYVVHANLLK